VAVGAVMITAVAAASVGGRSAAGFQLIEMLQLMRLYSLINVVLPLETVGTFRMMDNANLDFIPNP
jgi:hypothetical protein